MKTNLTSEQQKAADLILQYLAISDPLQLADAIFVAGGKNFVSVEKAAELFHNGLSTQLVFVAKTGKFTNPAWTSEAEEFYKKLLALGVPEGNMVWKSEATNTLEEAQITIPFLQKHGVDPKTMILVTKPYHQRRVFATFKNLYPEITFINAPARGDDLSLEEHVNRLIGEIERLQVYAQKGDLLQQETPAEVLQAVEILKKDFPGV